MEGRRMHLKKLSVFSLSAMIILTATMAYSQQQSEAGLCDCPSVSLGGSQEKKCPEPPQCGPFYCDGEVAPSTFDVNRNRLVSEDDAHEIIRYLNSGATSVVSSSNQKYDSNGDKSINPLDALGIVDGLNKHGCIPAPTPTPTPTITPLSTFWCVHGPAGRVIASYTSFTDAFTCVNDGNKSWASGTQKCTARPDKKLECSGEEKYVMSISPCSVPAGAYCKSGCIRFNPEKCFEGCGAWISDSKTWKTTSFGDWGEPPNCTFSPSYSLGPTPK